MDSFLHQKNLELLQRHLAESDPTKNPQRHKMLLFEATGRRRNQGKEAGTTQLSSWPDA